MKKEVYMVKIKITRYLFTVNKREIILNIKHKHHATRDQVKCIFFNHEVLVCILCCLEGASESGRVLFVDFAFLLCDPCSNPLLFLNSHTVQCASGDRETTTTGQCHPTEQDFLTCHLALAQEGYWSFYFIFIWMGLIFFIPFSFGRKGEELYLRKNQDLLPYLNGHAFPLSHDCRIEQKFQRWKLSET